MNRQRSGVRDHTAFPLWVLGLCVFFLCWGMFVSYYHLKFDLNIPPSTSGDEVDYDTIAWELAHGRGFQVDTMRDDFRQPYEIAARQAERFELGKGRKRIATNRPPLYPLAMSYLNRMFGRQFWATRCLDAACIAATLALIVTSLFPKLGWKSVFIALLLFTIIDTRTRLYGRAILTESMSLFLNSLLCVGLLRLRQSTKEWRVLLFRASLVGMVAGFSLLTRTLMILWIPGLVALVFWISWSSTRRVRSAVVTAFVFLFSFGCVITPWSVRNIKVTGEFMPLGTQGLMQLSAAFSDATWNSGGAWVNLDSTDIFDGVNGGSQTELERTITKAKYSRDQAVRWIKKNPTKTLLLMPLKVWREARPHNASQGIILLFACVGGVAISRTFSGQLLLGIVLTNFSAIAVTWSVDDGRFMVPVLYPIHIFAVVGACWIWSKFAREKFPLEAFQVSLKSEHVEAVA